MRFVEVFASGGLNYIVAHYGEGYAGVEAECGPAISVITWIEVMAGAASPDEEAVLRAFLLNFECLPVSNAVAERAAVVRRQKRLKMPDAIILATAEVAGRVLVTRNVKDFGVGVGGIRVPYKV